MILFPNCKINLGLHVTRKRDDGYHDLETVFYPVQLRDALEMIRLDTETGIGFTQSGIEIQGDATSNLCIKAYHLLRKDIPNLPGVKAHLHKAIPIGAGLGGGSADGAFALVLLNRLLQLNLPKEQLLKYALQLGSDCPFFLNNTPCLATGRGEQMKPLSLDLSDYVFVIVNPGIHISTADAFAGIKPSNDRRPLEEIIQLPVADWKELLVNDFEKSIGERYPQIQEIKEKLYGAGAAYACMTGSGSSVYGLFKKGTETVPPFPGNYFTYTTG